VAIAAILAFIGSAADAKSGNIIFPITTSGPPGTVVVLPKPIECASQPRLVLYLNKPGSPPADLTGGEPFDPTTGSVTIPQADPGEYQVILVCDGTDGAYFFFWVEPGVVLAQPRLAG
jgi:hypothetical protein